MPVLSRKSWQRWRVALFFAGWTLLMVAAVWCLIRSAQADQLPAKFVFGSNSDSQIPVGEQIRRWLRIADLNFRGAYPWVLLAPYVLWLASRFHFERNRLRTSVPIHILACALFATASQSLTTRLTEKRNFVIVMSEHRQRGQFLNEEMLTNQNPSVGIVEDQRVRVRSYGPHLGELRTKVLVTSERGGGKREPGLEEATDASWQRELTNWDARAEQIIEQARSGIAGTLGPPEVDRLFSSVHYDSRLFSTLLNILAYGSLAGIAHAVHFYRRYRERERKAVLLESHLAKAQLHTLQAQLQPHFLFNALNAVSTLLRRDPKAAQDALTSFSELLRLALSQSERQEIPLREDLRFLERYVEIQQTRLGDRFRFEQAIDPAALDCLVPTLLLQPLVENALRHGIELSSNPGTVRVEVKTCGKQLRFAIEDNGVGLVADSDQRKTGIGLSNLQARLQALYGEHQKVELISRSEGGVVVQMDIPLRYPPTEMAPAP